jgi:hypothetical protein
VFFEVASEQRKYVIMRSFAFREGMRAIGIFHEIEGLPELHEPVDQQLCTLIVDIIVVRTVDD